MNIELNLNFEPARRLKFKMFWRRISSFCFLTEVNFFLFLNTTFHINALIYKEVEYSFTVFLFKPFWISIFEQARKSSPARYQASKDFEFRSSKWLEIHVHLDIDFKTFLNFDLQTGSKFKSSSIFGFKTCWTMIIDLARYSK